MASQAILSGPYKGVRTTPDVFDGSPDLLLDASNLYSPDPENGVGFYSRTGWSLLNTTALDTGIFRGQAVFSFTDLSATTTNFCVAKGKLYRFDVTLTIQTDVTPVGITIDPGVTTRVYGTTFGNQLVINDGVNRPWIASDLSSTPITGTYIDFDGNGTAWVASGPAVPYSGGLVFKLASVNGVGCATDIAWSAPGDAATGYQQSPYDNRWTVYQTSTNPIIGLYGTNIGLYIFRARSIGLASGPLGPNFATTNTADIVSENVGSASPQSIVGFGDFIYFTDQFGRPYRLPIGGEPAPIWKQMRGIITSNAGLGFPGVTSHTVTAAIEPNENLYLVAIFPCSTAQVGPATEAYAFDAFTGIYMGRWTIATGYQIESLGSVVDQNGRATLVAMGSNAAPTTSAVAPSGYLWALNGITGQGDYLTTEDGIYLTTEASVYLTSEGIGTNWTDNGTVPPIYATSPRLGYDLNTIVTGDQAMALVGSAAPLTMSASTSQIATTVQGTTVTPNASQDGINRAVTGLSGVSGRGITVTVSPTTANSQWSVQQIAATVKPSTAGPLD